MNDRLKTILDRCNCNKLSLNPSKSELIIFTNKPIDNEPLIYLGNSLIERKSTVKYLGLNQWRHLGRAGRCRRPPQESFGPPQGISAHSQKLNEILFTPQFVDEFEHWACMQSDHDQYHQYLRAGGLNRRMQFADSPSPPFEFLPPPPFKFFFNRKINFINIIEK